MRFNEVNEHKIEDLQGEVWRDIPDYGTLYQVSSLGRVKSLGNSKDRKEKILKQQLQRDGYNRVWLCMKGLMRKRFPVHRLVAITFLPNPDNKPVVNHNNGDKLDNRLENLCWMTHKENVAHAYETGLTKTNNKPFTATHLDTGERRQFKRQVDASKELDVYVKHISNALNGRIPHAGRWRFDRDSIVKRSS